MCKWSIMHFIALSNVILLSTSTLSRYLCAKCCDPEKGANAQEFLLAWQKEVWWKWAGLMSSQVDRDRYWEVMCHALRKYLEQDKMVSGSVVRLVHYCSLEHYI